jgi:hypothetical protein
MNRPSSSQARLRKFSANKQEFSALAMQCEHCLMDGPTVAIVSFSSRIQCFMDASVSVRFVQFMVGMEWLTMRRCGTRSNRPDRSLGDVVRDDLLMQQGQGEILGMLVQITSSQTRLEQRVDGVSKDLKDLKTTVSNLSVDVKDLMHWKSRLLGMAILLGVLATGSGGIWVFIDRHVSWTSGLRSNVTPGVSTTQNQTHVDAR